LSTFANEMATSAMILGMNQNTICGHMSQRGFLGLVTSKSLVLIDELGRGTAPREGVGISHAIAESLVSIKVRDETQLYHKLTYYCSSVSSSLQRLNI
jgi:DNA mismatch repair protein MSH4